MANQTMHGGITMGMLLSKYEIVSFKEDWKELTTEELMAKYKESRYNIYEKAAQLNLPKRENNWWPQSKIEKFKELYYTNSPKDMMVIFNISQTQYYSKVRAFGLKKCVRI